MMDTQEVFETMLSHIRTQGGPGKGESGNCEYRTSDGKKCAVGCLIPDDVYESQMEVDVTTLSETFPRALAAVDLDDPEMLGLLQEMQNAHDSASPRGLEYFLEEFEKKTRIVAAKYGLNYPEK